MINKISNNSNIVSGLRKIRELIKEHKYKIYNIVSVIADADRAKLNDNNSEFRKKYVRLFVDRIEVDDLLLRFSSLALGTNIWLEQD